MRYRNFGAFLLAVPLSAAAFSMGKPETVSANSAPPYWNGSDGMGAILAGDRCPIEVEREHLRFSLTEFPAWEESAENFANYSGKFTAEYTFFNPTDSAVELSLVFPFGVLPDYYPYDEELDRASFGYAIRLDGADVPYTLRHTLDGQPYARGSSFDLEKGLERLYSSRKPFYFDDLPVKTYTYSIDAASLSDGGDVCYANF